MADIPKSLLVFSKEKAMVLWNQEAETVLTQVAECLEMAEELLYSQINLYCPCNSLTYELLKNKLDTTRNKAKDFKYFFRPNEIMIKSMKSIDRLMEAASILLSWPPITNCNENCTSNCATLKQAFLVLHRKPVLDIRKSDDLDLIRTILGLSKDNPRFVTCSCSNHINAMAVVHYLQLARASFPSMIYLARAATCLESGIQVVSLHGSTTTMRIPYYECSLLHIAVLHGRRNDILGELMTGADIDVTDSYGMTPLHIALFLKDTSMVEFILEKGADPRATNAYEATPFFIAIVTNQYYLFNLLYNKGANLLAPCNMQRAPLFVTIALQRRDMFISIAQCNPILKEYVDAGFRMNTWKSVQHGQTPKSFRLTASFLGDLFGDEHATLV